MYCLHSMKETTERFIFSPFLSSIFSMSMMLILFWFRWIKPSRLKTFSMIKILNRRYQHVNHRKLFLRSLLHPQNIITGTWTKKHKYGQLDLNYDILCQLLTFIATFEKKSVVMRFINLVFHIIEAAKSNNICYTRP